MHFRQNHCRVIMEKTGMKMRLFWLGLIAISLTSCASGSPKQAEPATAADEAPAADSKQTQVPEQVSKPIATVTPDDMLRKSQENADLMIYESWPLETSLDNDHIANVVPVWLDAINGAKETLDFSEYYAITKEDTGLDKVLTALEDAAQRGVKIRFLIDEKLNTDANAELPKVLAQMPNVELRTIDYTKITGGGVQHSKYFIVDGKTAYFGSQNFDWRSLEHISEMGARLRPEALVEPMKEIFEIDWTLAKDPSSTITKSACKGAIDIDYKGETTHIETVASPKEVLPCDDMWDLPKMIALIGQAKTSVSVQLLNYATTNYDKTKFTELDDALTAAAARGVKVRLLVSDWSTKPKTMADLKRLSDIPNIECRMLEVPEHSSGFVPYSRTIHSKFMVVDDADTWLGTSNWGGDYFYKSRNVGIIAHGKTLNAELTKSFEHYWDSPYIIKVDSATDYPVKNQAKKQ